MADMEEFKFPDEIEDKKEGGEVVAEDSFEVEVEDDTPEEDRGRTPLPKPLVEELEKDELEEYDDKVKTKLKQMRKVWHDERREKEAARREQQEAITLAQKLYEENKRIKALYSTGAQQFAETAKSAAELELAAAKRALKQAHEEFDAEKIVEAQQALNEAQMKVIGAKSYVPPSLQDDFVPVQTQQTAQPQPVRPDERAIAWQQRNPWFGQDEEMTAAALGLHAKLERNGVVLGSDEYYAALDNTMRKRFPEIFKGDETKPASRAKMNTVVAPATRSTSPNKIRLKSSQVQLAKKLGLTPEQYAREMMKLESQNG